MLKTETHWFGEKPAITDKDGRITEPARKGWEITCTQMPCSQQRDVFAWLLQKTPGAFPAGLVGSVQSKSEAGINFAYQWVRGILAAPDGIAYLQKTFGGYATTMMEREGERFPEPISEALCDELFGAELGIVLEFIVYNLIFNFSDVVSLMPDWGKGIPSIVLTAMMDGAKEKGAAESTQ